MQCVLKNRARQSSQCSMMLSCLCVKQHVLPAKLTYISQLGIAVVRGLWCTLARSWLKFRPRRATSAAMSLCADLSLVLSCRPPRVCVCRDSCRYLGCFWCADWRRALCDGGSLQLLEQVCTGLTCWSVRVVRDTVLVPAVLKLPQHKCRRALRGRQCAGCTHVHASATRLPACLDE